MSLKDAWEKLTDTYGSPVYIACLLLKDFFDLKLTKANDKTNMLQLNNALDKLESDLITNKCPERCEDFMIIDHTESLIPGRFRHKFVEKKDQLLTEHAGSYFKALSAFLKTKTSLIQKYMPDKIIEEVSKESSNNSRKNKGNNIQGC